MMLMLLALLATQAAAPEPEIAVHLRFDGRPLRVTSTPQFSCHEDNRNVWVNCQVVPNPDRRGYRLTGLQPGLYTLHVEIDENRDNPPRFPGDYDVFQQFEVTSDLPRTLNVDMLKLMRLRFPWNNNGNLDGMLTASAADKPVIETPRNSRTHTASVTFRWSPIVPGAEYTYVVHATRPSPFDRGPEVFRGTTRLAKVTLRLPLSAPDRYFTFELTARHKGIPIGEVFTHDAGVQAWQTEFVVRNWSGRTTTATVAPAADDDFLAEWQEAIPKPAWWNEVPSPPRPIRSLGDLLSAWAADTSEPSNRRRFYKLTYQAILDHSGDQHLVATGIHLMTYVADADDRLALLEFGLARFFQYQQRTDNCANCMTGDMTGEMVRDLAADYISRREYQQAIDLIQRLVDERDPEVSAYNMALTFETMSKAYWAMKDVERAKAAIREGLRRFPNGWQADQLRRTLERYDKEPAAPI